MYGVIHLAEHTFNIPFAQQRILLLSLKALVFTDYVQLENRTDPHAELQSNIFVGVRSTITSCLCGQAYGPSLLHPFLNTDFKVIKSSLISNCGEFAIIKIWIMNTLPYTKKLHGIAVTKPICNEEVTIFSFQHVCQTDVIFATLQVSDATGQSWETLTFLTVKFSTYS